MAATPRQEIGRSRRTYVLESSGRAALAGAAFSRLASHQRGEHPSERLPISARTPLLDRDLPDHHLHPRDAVLLRIPLPSASVEHLCVIPPGQPLEGIEHRLLEVVPVRL